MVRRALLAAALVLGAGGCPVAWYEADASDDGTGSSCPSVTEGRYAGFTVCDADEAETVGCPKGCVYQSGPAFDGYTCC